MYDISGSAHFLNKCDNGVVIHRNRDPKSGPIDQVQVSLSLSLSHIILFFIRCDIYILELSTCRFAFGR